MRGGWFTFSENKIAKTKHKNVVFGGQVSVWHRLDKSDLLPRPTPAWGPGRGPVRGGGGPLFQVRPVEWRATGGGESVCPVVVTEDTYVTVDTAEVTGLTPVEVGPRDFP